MSAVFEPKSPSELNAVLSKEVLEYVSEREEVPAEEIITAIKKGHPYMSPEPIVAAIWDLASRSILEVRGDWTVALRKRPAARHGSR